MLQRNSRLINSKVTKYLLPSVMMTMAMQLGGIVDTILVGNLLGTKAMSAIRLCMPIMTIEQAHSLVSVTKKVHPAYSHQCSG